MSRSRSHATAVFNISTHDLTDLGAGKQGWLDNPNLICALDSQSHSLAIANKFLILILDWSDEDHRNSIQIEIRPELSPIEGEFVSAVEWIGFGDGTRVLAVGTSSGYWMAYSLEGDLIHRQMVYHGRILKLRVQGMRRDLVQAVSSKDLTVIMPGVLARFNGSDIQSMLGRWFQEMETDEYLGQKQTRRGSDDFGNSNQRLPYQLWNVSKYGSSVDAAITGVMPPPLLEFESSQCYYCAVTVGNDAVISAFRLSEDRNRSLVGAILSRVVPATFSTIASVSRLIWRSDQTTKKSEPRPQPFARATPLTCLKDSARKGEKLTLTPSGTLAAITDSLGRILLLDTQALVVVRLWKGYRDANCLFMEMLVKKESVPSTSTYLENGKGDYCLCLVIHAPRKGIVEVWQMRTGPRLLAIKCAKGSRILQPAYRMGSSSTASSSAHVPLEVFLLDGDSGQLSVINRSLQ
ncbi:hypothetical protein Droror1_Dr00020269 [Drosera rotundifolia]